jgi:flagellar assembly factor FliW
LAADESPLLLTIVLIAAEWTQSTINLRAPLMVAPKTMRGAQIVLSDSTWRLNQSLPLHLAESVAITG